MKGLLEYFNKRVLLSDEETNFLINLFEKKDYGKGELLVENGKVCSNIYFVQEGCLKTYFVKEDGEEAINGIAIENNFCTSVASFVNQVTSVERIEAIEDTSVLAISYENFKILIETYPIFKEVYVKILEDYLTFMTWRIESIMIMNAKERYDTLLKNFPKLIDRLPKKIMAKYLGVSPETLSRLANKI